MFLYVFVKQYICYRYTCLLINERKTCSFQCSVQNMQRTVHLDRLDMAAGMLQNISKAFSLCTYQIKYISRDLLGDFTYPLKSIQHYEGEASLLKSTH